MLGLSLSVILFVIGVAYATRSILAEYHYGIGFGSHAGTPEAALSHLYKAAALDPLKSRFRMGPAVGLSVMADANGRPREMTQEAISAIRGALVIDYTRADLLAQLVSFEVTVGDMTQAERDYQRLKQLAPRAKVVIEIEKMREENPPIGGNAEPAPE